MYINTVENDDNLVNLIKSDNISVVRETETQLQLIKNAKVFKDKRPKRQPIFLKRGRSWIKVAGIPDQGADLTCGSYKQMKPYCIKTWDYMGPAIYLNVADSKRHRVRYKGLMQAKIECRSN